MCERAVCGQPYLQISGGGGGGGGGGFFSIGIIIIINLNDYVCTWNTITY